MAWRFRRSISPIKGLRINFGKSGVGFSVGVRGLRAGIDSKGRKYTTVGLPGTGLSNTTYAKKPHVTESGAAALQSGRGDGWSAKKKILISAAVAASVVALVVYLQPTTSSPAPAITSPVIVPGPAQFSGAPAEEPLSAAVPVLNSPAQSGPAKARGIATVPARYSTMNLKIGDHLYSANIPLSYNAPAQAPVEQPDPANVPANPVTSTSYGATQPSASRAAKAASHAQAQRDRALLRAERSANRRAGRRN